MRIASKSGRYQTAYDRAKEILADPSKYEEATQEYARQILKDSATILSEHYSDTISVHIATGNYDRALGVWTDVNAKVPELVEGNGALQLRMMRIYASRELWDQAREMASAAQSHAKTQSERDEAGEFLQNLDEMQRQESALKDLAQRVSELESKTGVDLSGGVTCGASSNEAVSEEDRQLMVDLEKARAELSTVRAALIKPPGINLNTPVEDAEASDTQS